MDSLAERLAELQALATAAAADVIGAVLMELSDILAELSPTDHRDPDLGAIAADLALTLYNQSSDDQRADFASRLVSVQTIPHALLEVIAADHIAIAEPILRQADLGVETLAGLITSVPQAHLCAIASRHDLDVILSAAIVERVDRSVLLTIVGNRFARFSSGTWHALIERGRQIPGLYTSMIQRPDIPIAAIQAIDRRASPTLHSYIAVRFRERLTAHGRKQAAIAEIHDLAARQQLRPSIFMRALHRKDLNLLAAALAHFSDMPFTLMRAAVRQADAVPLARLCAAIGVGQESFETILFINRRLQNLPQNLTVDERDSIEDIFVGRRVSRSVGDFKAA